MERRRHFNFTLGHELLCAAGGVVAGAMIAWWAKPTVVVSMDGTADEGDDYGFDPYDDGDCGVLSTSFEGGGEGSSSAPAGSGSGGGGGERAQLAPSPSGERTSEAAIVAAESAAAANLQLADERRDFQERRSKEIEELGRLRRDKRGE